MATTNITADNFASTVQQGLVVLDWWAPWCGPCRAFAPTYERVSEHYPDVVFGKVNTEDEPVLASKFEISAIPTLMVIKDGVLLFSQPGMVPAKALQTIVEKARDFDTSKLQGSDRTLVV